MKSLGFVLAAVLTISVVSPEVSLAEDGKRSISEKAKLAHVIDTLGEIASEDGHMEAFFYKEALSELRRPKCTIVAPKDIADRLARAMSEMDPGHGRISRGDAEIALTEFSELLGAGPFKKCESSFSENRSLTVLEQYTSADYDFELEWGYED